MNLGTQCRFSDDCPVYKGETKVNDMPLHLLRNVFCHRGYKGWKNCTRFNLLEQDAEVDETVTPYSNK